MIASLSLSILALRAGLAMRRRRTTGLRPKSELLRKHLALAKPAAVLVLLGFAGGVTSAVLLRGWEPVRSLHGGLALLAMLLFAATAWLGLNLERGRGERSRHGALGLMATGVALLAAMAGFVLLP